MSVCTRPLGLFVPVPTSLTFLVFPGIWLFRNPHKDRIEVQDKQMYPKFNTIIDAHYLVFWHLHFFFETQLYYINSSSIYSLLSLQYKYSQNMTFVTSLTNNVVFIAEVVGDTSVQSSLFGTVRLSVALQNAKWRKPYKSQYWCRRKLQGCVHDTRIPKGGQKQSCYPSETKQINIY